MKKQVFTIFSIATLLVANKSYGQFANTPTQNAPDQSTGGKVGIGTGAPVTRLHINHATATQLRLSVNGINYTDIKVGPTGAFLVNPIFNGNLSKVGFGPAAVGVDAGVGFQSSMGRFRMKDPVITTRGFDVFPNMTTNGNIPDGTLLTSFITAAGEGLSLSPNNAGEPDVKLGAYAFSGTTWNSMWETKNEASKNPDLLLVKNGGNVGVGPSTPASGVGFHSNVGVFRITDPLQTTRGLQILPNYPTANDNIPAGTLISSVLTTSGEGLSLIPCGTSAPGVKLGAYANYGTWFSMWEIENGSLALQLCKSGGNVGIGLNGAAPRANLDVAGNVYIGEQRPDITGPHNNAMLAVDGKILAKSIYVSISAGVWADYVFDKNYKLMPLNEVEKFYNENQHLPGIQSAKEVEKNGVSLEEMNIKLLEKVEELTIYLVKQQKEIDAMKKKLEITE